MSALHERMRTDLTAALRAKDRVTAAALRTALTAISNAEAIPVDHSTYNPVIGRPAEAPRRELTEAQIRAAVQGEVDERQHALTQYEHLGQDGHAEKLRAEMAVLRRYLGTL